MKILFYDEERTGKVLVNPARHESKDTMTNPHRGRNAAAADARNWREFEETIQDTP